MNFLKNPGDIISGAYDVRDRIRTHDLLVRSQSLYPAELHVHFTGFRLQQYVL